MPRRPSSLLDVDEDDPEALVLDFVLMDAAERYLNTELDVASMSEDPSAILGLTMRQIRDR